jgi:hypothetical protein
MDYKDYPKELPEPLKKSTYQSGKTFVKTNFDHSTRYRKSYCGSYTITYNWVLTYNEMKLFRYWYYNTLNNGTLSFVAGWDIEGSMKNDKVFHFYDVYSVQKSQDDEYYHVQAVVELRTPINELWDAFIGDPITNTNTIPTPKE